MELDKDALLKLYPEYTEVYGPYLRKDGRQHVVLYSSSLNSRKTVSLPKVLVEINTGERLKPGETVDHIDRDFTNDSLDNLLVRSRHEHTSLDVKRVEYEPIACVRCGTMFTPTSKHGRRESGPFCSRKCTGEHGADIQNNRGNVIKSEINKRYYYLDK